MNKLENDVILIRARINHMMSKLDKLNKIEDEFQRCRLGLRCKIQDAQRELAKMELEMSK